MIGPMTHEGTPRFLFVVGVARSGTTLLMRLLNTWPDVLVWGEHHTFVRPLAEAFYRVWESRWIFEDERPWTERVRGDELGAGSSAWINSFDRSAWENHFRTLLHEVFVPPGVEDRRFVGFKDPGYGAWTEDRGIELLHRFYPNALWAFIVRDGFNRLASARAMRRRDGQPCRLLLEGRNLCDCWVEQNHRLLEWHRSGTLESFWIRYEDLVRGRGEVHRLLEAMDRTWGTAQTALVDAGGNSSFVAPEDARRHDERWKTLPRAWLGLGHARMAGFAERIGYEPPPLTGLEKGVGRALLEFSRLATLAAAARRHLRRSSPGRASLERTQ